MTERRAAGEQAAWTSGLIFATARIGQLAFSAVMIANDRERFTSVRRQLAVFAMLSAESAWLIRRIVKRTGYDDRVGMWADTVTSAAGLLASHRDLAGGAAPWAKNVAIGSAIGASSAPSRGDAAGAVGLLCAAALAVGTRRSGRDAHVAGLALAANDAMSWSGMCIAARAYLDAYRNYANARDEADMLAVDRAVAAAAQSERGQQHERLHRITIDVLGRVARTTDLVEAQSLARAEAARLRYALRTEGRLPEGLDDALTEIAEQASVHVDLVTAELADAPPVAAPAVAAVRSAIEVALAAAGELGGAERAVLRAHADGDEIQVSIRDHGRGYDLDEPGDYARLEPALASALEQIGGTVRIWSEPGSGVRVELAIAADTGLDDPQHGVPDPRIGPASAGDDDHAVVDHDINAGGAGRTHRAQHEVSIGRGGDLDTGVTSESLEPAAQQRWLRSDAGGGWARHLPRIAGPRRAHMGSSAQFRELPPAETRRADRTLLTALLTWRATGLATGAASLAAGAARYRSRPVAAAQLGIGVVESAWLARRLLRRERWSDRAGSAVDATTAVALLVLGQRNLDAPDRVTWINWTPWSFAVNAIAAQSMPDHPRWQRVSSAAAISATHAAQGPTPGDALANVVAHAGFGIGARFMATRIRVGAVQLEQARAGAIEQGRALAAARERVAQLRLLHDSAVQTLEAIASGRHVDLAAARQRAEAEAMLLTRELERTAQGAALPQLLTELTSTHAEQALRVEVELATLPELPSSIAEALAAACHEALTNVTKHANTNEVRVRVHQAGAGVVVVIEDHGTGFRAEDSHEGFGVTHSIYGRMADIGGSADVVSSPDTGTRVTLRWPA
ncbi:MAG TPA: ATP-binding protein [Jatrophihabitantaceae bacterium]|nr:ATP-binding protein [Jatrophihabitantaceae bacterium]